MEEEEYDFQVVTDKPEPDFEDLAAAALNNAGIGTADWLRAARVAAAAAAAAPIWPQDGPRLIEAEPDEMVYEIIVELPDAGLLPGLVPDAPEEPITPPNNDPIPATSP